MDSCKKRVPFVRDFAREIKKVRVVAWFDEKEAGAKAVHRERFFRASFYRKAAGSFPSDSLSEEP